MNAQHTPGPWTHEGQGDITGIENDPGNGCVGKVDVACVYLRTVPGRNESNARLIAAAPEMLRALRAIVEESNDPGAVDFARAAIAKAEGEQA